VDNRDARVCVCGGGRGVFSRKGEEVATREKNDNSDFRRTVIYEGNYIVRHDEITVHKYRNYSRLRVVHCRNPFVVAIVVAAAAMLHHAGNAGHLIARDT